MTIPAPRRYDPLAWPPVWLAMFGFLAWLFGRLWPIVTYPSLGWALVGIGLLLMASALLTMTRAHATFDPTQQPTALVTSGVFQWSRNPIYLADVIVLLGLCLVWQPLSAVLLVPAFIWLLTTRFIRQEEGWLSNRYPEAFAAWSARTRRWL